MTAASDRPTGHVLMRVENLGEAIRQAIDAGFRVLPGSPGPDPRNGLIHLADGWFLELFPRPRLSAWVRVPLEIALRWWRPEVVARFDQWTRGEAPAVVDWAIDVDDVEAAHARLGDVPCGKSISLSRKQVDGSMTRWRLAAPRDPRLPFLMGPYVGHVPVEPWQQHPNGARALLDVPLVEGADPEALASLLQRLGHSANVGPDSVRLGAIRIGHGPLVIRTVGEARTLQVGGHVIELQSDRPR
ncbi:MAG: VOC family protein [Myxococcota bacterium]